LNNNSLNVKSAGTQGEDADRQTDEVCVCLCVCVCVCVRDPCKLQHQAKHVGMIVITEVHTRHIFIVYLHAVWS